MADVDGFDALPGAGDIRAGLATLAAAGRLRRPGSVVAAGRDEAGHRSVAPVGGTPCRGRRCRPRSGQRGYGGWNQPGPREADAARQDLGVAYRLRLERPVPGLPGGDFEVWRFARD